MRGVTDGGRRGDTTVGNERTKGKIRSFHVTIHRGTKGRGRIKRTHECTDIELELQYSCVTCTYRPAHLETSLFWCPLIPLSAFSPLPP